MANQQRFDTEHLFQRPPLATEMFRDERQLLLRTSGFKTNGDYVHVQQPLSACLLLPGQEAFQQKLACYHRCG